MKKNVENMGDGTGRPQPLIQLLRHGAFWHQARQTIVVAREVPNDVVDRIIRHHMWWSLGMGLLPLPLLDLAAITGVQINLLRTLAKLYGMPFLRYPVRKGIASLLASVMPVLTAPTVAASVTKVVPVMGQAAGVLTLPALGGAATYALGKVFSVHFASGGTFLTFDPEQARAYYAEAFREGHRIALQRTRQTPEPCCDDLPRSP